MKLSLNILASTTKSLLSLAISALVIVWSLNILAADAPVDLKPVSITFSGVDIITINSGVGSFSTTDRANAILTRIDSLAHDKRFDISKISVEEREFYTDVVAGDLILISLDNNDAEFSKLPRKELAEKTAKTIKEAIDKDRREKSPKQLWLAAGYAILATIILFLLFFFIAKAYPKIVTYIENLNRTYIGSIRIRSIELLSVERLNDLVRGILGFVRIFLSLLIVYVYLPLVLSLFPWTTNYAPRIINFAIDPIKKISHVLVEYIPNLFFIAVAVVLTRYLLRFIKLIFTEIEKGTLHFEGFYKEWAEPTYQLVRFLVLAFMLIVVFPYLPGAGSPAFQGVSVFIGVLFSLGSSSAISNIVGGVVLTYMRPFKIGDRVKIADTMGDIVEKSLLITRVRTIKNVEITIPNAMVLGSHIINYSASAEAKGLILNTTVTIGYDIPWKTVHNLLKSAAAKTPGVLTDPEPFILQTSLNDFYVSYELNAHTRHPNKMAATYSALHQNIQDEFNAAKVEIMSPHYTALRDGNEITIPQPK